MSNIIHHQALVEDIDAFLAETGMGASYFGKVAAKNSEVVARLKTGGRVWPETETAIRDFMARTRAERQQKAS